MRRLALVLALLVTGACAPGAEDDHSRTFAAAQQALRRGAIDEALSLVDRLHAAAAADVGSPRGIQVRLLRAEILIAKPDLAGAVNLLGTPVPDRPELAALRARDRYLHARVQVARGHLQDALTMLESIAAIAPDAKDVQLDGEILAGQVLLRLGRSDEGDARLKSVVRTSSESGDRYRQVLALNNLGMGLIVRNRLDEAVTWFERVLSFEDLADTSVYAVAMNNAGACYARLGDFDRAVAVQKRAVALHENRGAAGPYEQALGELGTTYLLLDDRRQAVQHLTNALDVAARAGLNADAAVWARNLAGAYVQLGDWESAERVNAEAKRLNPPERASRLIFNTLHDANIAVGRGRTAEGIQLFNEILASADGTPNVRWAAHEGLALIARRSGDARRAAAHLDAALAIIERTRSDLLKTDDRLSFVTRLMRFYREYVDLLIEQGQVERALAIADSSRGRVLAERHGVALPAATSPSFRRIARESNRVLVSYWLTDHGSYAWVVDEGAVRLHSLAPAPEIEPLVREHQRAIHSALADPLASGAAGDRLFQLLVAPLELGPGASVIIVPDGALHGLNFETLPVAGRYWIEDVELQIAPALGLLADRGDATPARSLLVFGNPTAHGPEFPELRHASTEMASIVRHFGAERSKTYQGERASPQSFREAHPEEFALVHFTAHATANRDSPLDSAVILSGPDDGFKLYARDVAELPLRAELVTVSACRSAGERVYTGEGLVGFAWAFLRAGARRVIAGLWDVDDRSTAALMDDLYARLAKGEAPARALREAKLRLIARGGVTAKPYYWGPFQLFTVSPD